MTENHLIALARAAELNVSAAAIVTGWGSELARILQAGGRLLACGNGGSAAQAQHLTGELVGRFRHDRDPYAAIALHADTSALTAILNDYGLDEMFARQVRAHGRAGDVLVAFSTSGSSSNVLAAAKAAQQIGVTVWALTGPAPNPLAAIADDAVVIDAGCTATIQEIHLALTHGLCLAMDEALGVPT
ncbi:MAG: D-sedoheptulose 7-phosphate isomerase [Propionibacteriaceae bacterium]|nr:gmhA [Propionibacteriaceae bacterium]MDX6322388.1 D-sedoheptulose 7-phosphate isomerase [Propionibacteriaceae bacterium]